MKKIKKKVHLTVLRNNSYSVPNSASFQKKYPDYINYNAAIYINHFRVSGAKDYNRMWLFDTERAGIPGIETIEILRALQIPEEIINQIEFED